MKPKANTDLTSIAISMSVFVVEIPATRIVNFFRVYFIISLLVFFRADLTD